MARAAYTFTTTPSQPRPLSPPNNSLNTLYKSNNFVNMETQKENAPPRRYKGIVIPLHEYVLFRESPSETKTFYHLLVNPAQHERILSLQDHLLATFDEHKTGKKLSFQTVSPTDFGLTTTTEQPHWYLYTYVRPQSDEDIRDSSSHNLYVRCIYWENADTFYKNGVALAGLRMVTDDGPRTLNFSQLQRV
jgi:hypothetical protein